MNGPSQAPLPSFIVPAPSFRVPFHSADDDLTAIAPSMTGTLARVLQYEATKAGHGSPSNDRPSTGRRGALAASADGYRGGRGPPSPAHAAEQRRPARRPLRPAAGNRASSCPPQGDHDGAEHLACPHRRLDVDVLDAPRCARAAAWSLRTATIGSGLALSATVRALPFQTCAGTGGS